ncbi:hypothetical protein [Streptomyces xanthophaeus]
MTMEIGGEDHEVSPEAWKVFDDWYGDKSYRHADLVAAIEAAVRARVAREIEQRGWRLRSSAEGISREEWSCYDDASSVATKGLAIVESE